MFRRLSPAEALEKDREQRAAAKRRAAEDAKRRNVSAARKPVPKGLIEKVTDTVDEVTDTVKEYAPWVGVAAGLGAIGGGALKYKYNEWIGPKVGNIDGKKAELKAKRQAERQAELDDLNAELDDLKSKLDDVNAMIEENPRSRDLLNKRDRIQSQIDRIIESIDGPADDQAESKNVPTRARGRAPAVAEEEAPVDPNAEDETWSAVRAYLNTLSFEELIRESEENRLKMRQIRFSHNGDPEIYDFLEEYITLTRKNALIREIGNKNYPRIAI